MQCAVGIGFRDILGPALRKSQKCVFQYKNAISLRGGRRSLPDPMQNSAPGLQKGAPPPDPRYRLVLGAKPIIFWRSHCQACRSTGIRVYNCMYRVKWLTLWCRKHWRRKLYVTSWTHALLITTGKGGGHRAHPTLPWLKIRSFEGVEAWGDGVRLSAVDCVCIFGLGLFAPNPSSWYSATGTSWGTSDPRNLWAVHPNSKPWHTLYWLSLTSSNFNFCLSLRQHWKPLFHKWYSIDHCALDRASIRGRAEHIQQGR